MKRRTYHKLRADRQIEHHHVYVVLLDSAVRKLRSVRAANPNADETKQCVYVGMTGLDPAQRFTNHKQGIKASSVVTRYGVRLMPELYAQLNPMPFAGAVQMEADLADDL